MDATMMYARWVLFASSLCANLLSYVTARIASRACNKPLTMSRGLEDVKGSLAVFRPGSSFADTRERLSHHLEGMF